MKFEFFSFFILKLGEVGVGDFYDTEVLWGFVSVSEADKVEKAVAFVGHSHSEPGCTSWTDTQGTAVRLFCSRDQGAKSSAGEGATLLCEVVGVEGIATHGVGIEGFPIGRDVPVDGIRFGSQSKAALVSWWFAVNGLLEDFKRVRAGIIPGNAATMYGMVGSAEVVNDDESIKVFGVEEFTVFSSFEIKN